VNAVVRALGLDGPFATVTAGWQEREGDDGELSALLGGPTANLSLYRRFGEVLAADGEYAAAVLRRREILAEMAELYLLRLDLAVQAVRDIGRHDGSAALRESAQDQAVRAIRDLDLAHLRSVQALDGEFYTDFPPHERDSVAAHRAEIAGLMGGCGALVMTGGHVGVLAEVLHLFNIAALLHASDPEFRVVTWSAGAMALTDRIVLFHDRSEHGPASAEVHGTGLGVVPRVVALPGAHRRLRMDDQPAMALLARRFAPAGCLVLEAGDRVDLADDGGLPAGAAVLGPDGAVAPWNAADRNFAGLQPRSGPLGAAERGSEPANMGEGR
jgi:hypothetical protein